MSEAPRRETTSVRKCPICGKPRDPKYNPFCSRRCADVDLGRWLKGNYVIPGDERSDRVRPSDEDE
jgi:endogenous inhibitor of DNA gyrase (YacG/DUF329 family)